MKLRYTALTLVSLMALAALAASQGAWAQAPLIERVKLTDNEMSCQMIYGEIRQMEGFTAAAPAPAAAVVVAAAPVAEAPNPLAHAATQQAVAQIAARGGFGGMFGGLMNAVAQTAPAAAQPQQAAAAPVQPNGLAAQAQARKEHLTSLFLGKGCKLSDVQR